jgi:hypothetical protein
MKPGDRFTRATVVALVMRNGRTHADCLCDCGKTYSTRPTNLVNGISHGCRSCALKGKAGRHFMESREKALRRAERDYQSGAFRRDYGWALNTLQFRELISGPCFYCGEAPAKGIDRQKNEVGYTVENCVSCCKRCNFSKRTSTVQEFLSWVYKIAAYQGFSL